MPPRPSFSVESGDLTDGQPQSSSHAHSSTGGENRSPHLAWSGFPVETRSFAVTCYDPDAPTGSGFWHWVLFNIPLDVTELGTGASGADTLPVDAVEARNDYGEYGFGGAAPPSGDGPHRYVYTVHALDTEHLDLPPETTPAYVGFNLTAHALARGVLRATYEIV